MTFRSVAISSAITVVSVVTAPSARGECFVLTAKYVMEAQDVELVFSGTVIHITRSGELGYRATFDVDRIWKGPCRSVWVCMCPKASRRCPAF
jgi:hypothetical protein